MMNADVWWRELEFEGYNGIMRRVLDLLVDMAWECLPYHLATGMISTLLYETVALTNRIVILGFPHW